MHAPGTTPTSGKAAIPTTSATAIRSTGPTRASVAIATPPFCAVAVEPTPLGTSLGLRTDASARVCDGAGNPIPGLFACGNDMDSPFGGEYPGAGAQIGLAMTFGYVAAQTASRLP